MKPNRTENHILFDCEVELLNNQDTDVVRRRVNDFIEDYYANDGEEVNNNFSHDNWKGVACWCKRFDQRLYKMIPLFARHAWRPDNFFLFLYIKNKYVGFLFIWIYLLFQVVDAIRMRKDARGIPHTSGLLLNYFVMQTFGFKLTFKFIDWRVRKTFDGGWLEVFTIYYNQPHNIRVVEAFKK